MPRAARKKSESGIYHIILRGINKQTIFEDDEDRLKFLQTLSKYKDACRFNIFAYCLMDNHIHILLKEGKEELAMAMRRIGACYVYWYNYKYGRCGHLFQDRFKSEAVDDDSYLLSVIRYIHQNPLKARMVKNIAGHKWSSYNEYIKGSNIVDIDFVLDIFDENRERALKRFEEFNNESNNDNCLELDESKRITDNEARELIRKKFKIDNCTDLQGFELKKRNSALETLKNEGLSSRQVERLTGISRAVVAKV